MDSTPLVVISGQVATSAIGTDAFQECDITGVTMGITKHNWLVKRAEDIPRTVAAAFHVATTGRPGPGAHRHPEGRRRTPRSEWYWPESEADLDLPGYHPRTEGDPAAVRGGRRADAVGRAAGALRRAAGCSRPAARRRCSSWPSGPVSRW